MNPWSRTQAVHLSCSALPMKLRSYSCYLTDLVHLPFISVPWSRCLKSAVHIYTLSITGTQTSQENSTCGSQPCQTGKKGEHNSFSITGYYIQGKQSKTTFLLKEDTSYCIFSNRSSSWSTELSWNPFWDLVTALSTGSWMWSPSNPSYEFTVTSAWYQDRDD